MFKILDELHDRSLTSLADALPWRMVVDDGVVMTNLGGYLGAFEWIGPNPDDISSREYLDIAQRLNDEMMRLGRGWTMIPDCGRYRVDAYHAPNPSAPPIVQLLDDERRVYYTDAGAHYGTAVHYSFAYHEPQAVQDKTERYFFDQSGLDESECGASRARETFERGIERLARVFGNAGTVRLRRLGLRPVRDADGSVVVYDDLLSYLYYTVRGIRHPIIAPPAGMTVAKLFSAHEAVFNYRPTIDQDAVAIVRVTVPPNGSWLGMLASVFNMQAEYRANLRAILYSTMDAERKVTRGRDEAKQNMLGFFEGMFKSMGKSQTPNRHSVHLVQEAEKTLERVQNNEISAANVTFTITFFGQDRARTLRDAETAVTRLGERGFVASLAQADAGRVYFGSLPGDTWSDVDAHSWTTANVSHCCPITSVWPGVDVHPCGYYDPDTPPHIIGVGSGGTPVRLPLHWNLAANTLVIGGARSGKSVHLKRIAWQHLFIPHSNLFAFDRDEAMYLLANVLVDQGVGAYYRFDDPAFALCMLEFIHESLAEVQYALSGIEALCTWHNVTITPARRNKIKDAILRQANYPQRRLSDLYALISDTDVRDAINYYSDAETLVGRIMNGQGNGLARRRAQIFEMSALSALDDKDRLPIVRQVMHLADRTTMRKDPTALLFDEARPAMHDRATGALLVEMLQRWPKRNAFTVIGTQGISDVLTAPIGMTVLQECKTRILAGDASANDPAQAEALERAGVPAPNPEIIARNAAHRRYRYLSPLGASSYSLDLQACELAALTCDEGDDLAEVKALRQAHPDDWFQRHLRKRGLADWADHYDRILRQYFRHNSKEYAA